MGRSTYPTLLTYPTPTNFIHIVPPRSPNTRQDDVIKSTDSLTKSALSDLSSLMDRAREVVAVVQRYSAYVEQVRRSSIQPGVIKHPNPHMQTSAIRFTYQP